MHAFLNSHEVSRGWLFSIDVTQDGVHMVEQLPALHSMFLHHRPERCIPPAPTPHKHGCRRQFRGWNWCAPFCPQLQFERKPTAGETARLRPCDAATVPGGDVAGGRRVGHDSLRTYKRATSTGNHSPGRTTQSPFAHQQPAKPAI